MNRFYLIAYMFINWRGGLEYSSVVIHHSFFYCCTSELCGIEHYWFLCAHQDFINSFVNKNLNLEPLQGKESTVLARAVACRDIFFLAGSAGKLSNCTITLRIVYPVPLFQWAAQRNSFCPFTFAAVFFMTCSALGYIGLSSVPFSIPDFRRLLITIEV